jgi:hypothetical protein
MRRILVAVLACAGSLPAVDPGLAAQGGGGDCVTIAKPNPAATYVFRHEDSGGAVTEFTQQWKEVSETGSAARTTRRGVVTVQTTAYKIREDGVSLISVMTNAGDSTQFRPAMIGDPVFRACAGLSWAIPAVTAYYQGGGRSASAATQSGQLRIISVNASVTVPAGTFRAVHYTRTMNLPKGQNFNQYWKSIEHGVVVQHTSTLPAGRASEVLIAIRR